MAIKVEDEIKNFLKQEVPRGTIEGPMTQTFFDMIHLLTRAERSIRRLRKK